MLLLETYPLLHVATVHIPHEDYVPALQVRFCDPVPFVIVQACADEPEHPARL